MRLNQSAGFYQRISACVLAACIAISGATAAYASPVAPALGRVSYSGSGCPAGSASVTLSPDARAVSVLFDQYSLSVRKARDVNRKNCRLNIPVIPPAGYRLKSLRVDYRGFYSLPAKTRAKLELFYELPDLRGPQGHPRRIKKLLFRGPADEEFAVNDAALPLKRYSSVCGKPFRLVAGSQVTVDNRTAEEALFVMDSADAALPLDFELEWEKCQPARPRPPHCRD